MIKLSPTSFLRGSKGGKRRHRINKRFLLDLAEDWQQHGREVQVRSARVAGGVLEGLRNPGAERDEGRAPGGSRGPSTDRSLG